MQTKFERPALLSILFAAIAAGSLGTLLWSAYNTTFEKYYVLMPLAEKWLKVVLFLSVFLLARQIGKLRSVRATEELFRDAVIASLITLALFLLPDLFLLSPSNNNYLVFLNGVYPEIGDFILLLFLTTAFNAYRKVIIGRQRNVSSNNWRFITVLILLGAFAPLVEVSTPVLYGYYTICALSALPLLFRLHWVALLSLYARITTFFYLMVVGWVFVGLSVKLMVSYNAGLFYPELFGNPFLVVLMFFVGAYSVLGLLALVFSLPVTNVMEKRDAEIQNFQDMVHRINKVSNTDDIFDLLFEICVDKTGVKGGWLTQRSNGLNNTRILKTDNVSVEQVSKMEEMVRSSEKKQNEKENFIYVPDLKKKQVTNSLTPEFQSMLIFPLFKNHNQAANLVVLEEHRNAFNKYEIQLLGTYVDQARIAIENKQLLTDAVESERARNDVEIARRVQGYLLPQRSPSARWLRMAFTYEPASEVGGDYYDYFEKEDHLYGVVGDVSGKGMSAAFNVAELKGMFNIRRDLLPEPVQFMTEFNAGVSACFQPGVFLTMIYIDIDRRENEFNYIRAGHCPLLYYKASEKKAVFLEDKGMALGVLRTDAYKKHIRLYRRKFDSNDVMVLYTDGVIEAKNVNSSEEYGYERLRKVVERHAYFKAEDIRDRILADVDVFLEEKEPHDDITLMVVKFS